MRILVACEFSGVIRDAFVAKGHDAWSCDLLPTEAPGNHYICDVREVLNYGWDMLISHPPCTYLSAAGNAWLSSPGRLELREQAIEFVRFLWAQDIPRIVIENPVGYLNVAFRKPDQIIQPYHFGEQYSKRTCLWLKNVPPLMSTLYCIDHREYVNSCKFTGEKRRAYRSRTFPGIAKAMSEQWSF